jgi:phosphatidylserine/phosphatidylglycerophosphate/cardiolipin synthase-like enzyme
MALHAKSMVVDGRISVVGSFNLDPRSANLNTESITIIHSESVAKHLLDRMETEMTEDNAWRRTDSYNPDKHARLFRRFRVFLSGFVPLSIL